MLRKAISILAAVTVMVNLFLAPVGVSAAGSGNVYYIDSIDGNDNNSGISEGFPWKTLDKVNSITYQPGDTILFKRGAVWSGQLAPKGSGSEGNPIVINAYGTGSKPVINGDGVIGGAVFLINQEYWEINSLEITNTAEVNSACRQGVRITAWDEATIRHIYLKDLYIHDVVGYNMAPTTQDSVTPTWDDWNHSAGVLVIVGGSSTQDPNVKNSYMYDIKIEDCNVSKNTSKGIVTFSWNGSDQMGQTGGSIYNLLIQNNILDSNDADGMYIHGAYAPLVQYNISRRSHNACPNDYAAGIFPIACWNSVFQYNESYETGTKMDGEGFDIDWNTDGTIFQYNYSHENQGGFLLVTSFGAQTPPKYNQNTVIRYNISQNDAYHVFNIQGPLENTKIYNNAIYLGENVVGDVIKYSSWNGYPKDVYYYNNIFYILNNGGYTFSPASKSMFENNCFYGSHPASEPQDKYKITADPKLVVPGTGGAGLDTVGGYKLQQGSPLINAGKLIAGNGGKDYWGNAVSAEYRPNIGPDNSYNTMDVPDTTPVVLPKTLLKDDFEDGNTDGWTVNGSWSVQDVSGGKTYVLTDTSGSASAGSSSWTDYTVSADLTPDFSGTGYANFNFRAAGANSYYMAVLSNGSGGTLSVLKREGGTDTLLAEKPYPVTDGQKYTVAVSVKGNSFDVSVNGVKELITYDTTFAKGGISFSTWNSSLLLDNVNVNEIPDASAQDKVLFSDDFEGVNSNNWTVTNGNCSRAAIAGNNWAYYADANSSAYGGSADWTDYAVTADITLTPSAIDFSEGSAELNFRDSFPKLYKLAIYSNSSDPSRNSLTLYKDVVNTTTWAHNLTTLDSTAYPVELGKTYKIRINAKGDKLEVYVDGSKVLSAVDNEIPSGLISLSTWQRSAYYDNIIVTDLSGTDASSDLKEVEVFRDDFEDGNSDGWWTSWGDWAIADDGTNTNKVFHLDAASTGGGLGGTGKPEWTDYSVSADITLLATNFGDTGYTDMNFRADGDNLYKVGLSSAGKLSLIKQAAGVQTSLAEKDYMFETGHTYNIKAVAVGSRLEVYVNGSQELYAEDSDFTAGVVTFGTWHSSIYLDNVVINTIQKASEPGPEPEPEPYFPGAVKAAFAKTVPVIDGNLSEWENVGGTVVALNDPRQVRKLKDWIWNSETLNAEGKLAWDQNNLYLGMTVTDDIHSQTNDANGLWQGDSIQLALDPVRNTPGAFGFTEIGLAVNNSGQILANRWSAVNGSNLTTGSISLKNCSIIRDEKNKKTVYEAAIPWTELLGDTSIIKSDAVLGFSMLINENDGAERMGYLEYNSGIGGMTKNPALYGDLILLPEQGRPVQNEVQGQPAASSGTEITTQSNGNTLVISTNIKPTVDESAGMAKAKLDASLTEDIYSKAKAGGTAGKKTVVQIKLEGTASVKSVEVEIPRDTINRLAKDVVSAVSVSSGIGTVTLDENAVKAVSGAADAGSISIVIRKVENSSLTSQVQAKVGDRPVYDFSVRAGNIDISGFGSGKAEVSVPYTPKAGEKENSIVVYYIDNTGKLQTVRGQYNPKTGMVSFKTAHFSRYALGYNEVSFKDVNSGDWFSRAVGYIAAREITTGTGKGDFCPESKVTRGDFIVMLMKAYNIAPDSNPEKNFSDAGNKYYTGYLAAAKRLGIASGIGGNRFAPDKEITREEMLTLLYNALKVIDELPQGTGGRSLAGFSDQDRISSWAKNAVLLFAESGIISGSVGKISPEAAATRAQIAQVLYNLLSK